MTTDLDAVYRALGEFVLCFLALEHEIQQLGAVALNVNDQFTEIQRLRDFTFSKQVQRVQRAVEEQVRRYVPAHAEPHVEPYLARVATVLSDCQRLIQKRNELMHSSYHYAESFDTLLGILRSYQGPATGALHQEWVSPANFVQVSREVAAAAFQVGHLRTQLIHWLP
ncbi:hypothetical protein [Deinococcus koreensis]|uniref:Uncharacterized protein n=1 Tax=Deinococcus koreensis TaxID=2054903 RepID=A0A2K3URK2_9DEIO|nr:hypothetical protein [Deinococcus koreensis]PNY79171.1 hypothetical protein CVO96_20435 [Deinococcus koreensis]